VTRPSLDAVLHAEIATRPANLAGLVPNRARYFLAGGVAGWFVELGAAVAAGVAGTLGVAGAPGAAGVVAPGAAGVAGAPGTPAAFSPGAEGMLGGVGIPPHATKPATTTGSTTNEIQVFMMYLLGEETRTELRPPPMPRDTLG
jgi:hypothetical protein